MSITSRVATLSTTPQLLETGTGDGKTVIIKNPSATIFLGPIDVTAATGLPLLITDFLSVVLTAGDDLYAIASAATPTVNLMVLRDNQ